jgi:hypothetical protein
MKKSIRCLNYRQNLKYERQCNKPLSDFTLQFMFRHKRHGLVPPFMKCLFTQSIVVGNVIARRYGHLMPTVLELLWMIREGRAIYKMLAERYPKTDNSVTE